jgi:type II secretion system protein H
MRLGPPYQNRVRAARAFTLMEIMVVVVLISILTAMIIPEMKGTFEDTLLRSTGRELVNVIELASSRAVSLNQTLRVKIDPTTGRYETERQQHEGSAEDFVPLDGVTGSQGKLDKRISVQIFDLPEDPAEASATPEAPAPNLESQLTFYPDGTADGSVIMLKDRAGFQLELRLSAVTSRITILEPARQ